MLALAQQVHTNPPNYHGRIPISRGQNVGEMTGP